MKVKKHSKDINSIFAEATTDINLEGMTINAANFEKVSEELLKKKEVKVLNLGRNKLGKDRLGHLCKIIAMLPHLEVLDLRENILSTKGLVYVNTIIVNAKSLKKLNLAHNMLGLTSKDRHNFSNFAKTIANHPALESLDVSKNDIKTNKLISLIRALENHPTLRELNLSGNEFDGHGADLIGELLTKNQRITSLSVAYNQDEDYKPLGFHGRLFSILIEPILTVLKENSSLQVLDLSGIQLRISELELLKKVLEKNTTLTVVKWNEKPHRGEDQEQEQISQLCQEIHSALKRNTSLLAGDISNSEKMNRNYQRQTP